MSVEAAGDFYDLRFPERIARGARGGPGFRTRITARGGGGESANRKWRHPLWSWDAARGIKTRDDYEQVLAFFLIVGGKWGRFRFRNFLDYALVNERIDTSAGGRNFRLTKVYRFGAREYVREIWLPVFGTVELTLNNQTVQFVSEGQQGFDAGLFGEVEFGKPEAAFVPVSALDYNTGRIALPFDLTPADDLRCSCEYDVPVRFDIDQLDAALMIADGTVDYGAILLQEMRKR